MASPNFTKKHYQAIAEVLRVQRARIHNKLKIETNTQEYLSYSGSLTTVDVVASDVSDLFERDNPRFDKGLFLAVVRGEKPVTARPARKTRTS